MLLMDRNQDGFLDEAEIQDARRQLLSMDYNNDGVIGPMELRLTISRKINDTPRSATDRQPSADNGVRVKNRRAPAVRPEFTPSR